MTKNYLIGGASGTGKSSIARELQSRGYYALDADYDAGIAYWQNKRTGREEAFPENPLDSWGIDHHWRWHIDKLAAALIENTTDQPTIVCGTSSSRRKAFDLFDTIFVLKASHKAIRRRIAERTDNDFGKQPKELTWLLAEHDRIIEEAQQYGFKVIDTSTKSIVDVADEIEDYIQNNN